MKTGRAVAAVAAAGLILVATPGIAGAKVVTKAVTDTLPPLQMVPVTITADCPAGSNVLSGGWRTTAGIIAVYDSRRTGKRSWTITAERVTNDLTPGNLTAYAYCDTKAKRSRSASASDTVATDEIATTTPHCNGELGEQSGGWKAEDFNSPGGGVVIRSDLDALDGWKTRLLAYTDPATLTGFNYCMRLGDRDTYLRATNKQAETVRTRKCKRGDVPVAGGFRLSADEGVNPYVNVFRREGRRWRIDADGADSDLNRVRLQVICLDA